MDCYNYLSNFEFGDKPNGEIYSIAIFCIRLLVTDTLEIAVNQTENDLSLWELHSRIFRKIINKHVYL